MVCGRLWRYVKVLVLGGSDGVVLGSGMWWVGGVWKIVEVCGGGGVGGSGGVGGGGQVWWCGGQGGGGLVVCGRLWRYVGVVVLGCGRWCWCGRSGGGDEVG